MSSLEVKQTWLGFSLGGNKGRGLGPKFATALDSNLARIFSNMEKITVGEHLEKLGLIGSGVGKDGISDFTTNLISGFLAEYTQQFAKKYLTASECGTFYVHKARFNYDTEVWEDLPFYLPKYRENFPRPKNDYVLLVPLELLTRDDTWINYNDFVKSFEDVRDSMENESLRSSINNYLYRKMPKSPDAKEVKKAVGQTIDEFPILIDYYIRLKEENGDKAVALSSAKVDYAKTIFLKNFTRLANLIYTQSNFYDYSFTTMEDSIERARCLKYVIENRGGYRFLYNDSGDAISREEELAIAHRFIWFNMPVASKENEIVDPRKAVPVAFKLGSNRNLKTFFEKKDEDAKKFREQTGKQITDNITVVFLFSEHETKQTQSFIKGLGYIGHIVLIYVPKLRVDEFDSAISRFDRGNIEGEAALSALDLLEVDSEDEVKEPTKVFISYSHDYGYWKSKGQPVDTQKKRVFDLAERLRSEGILCEIDQQITNPSEGWPRWMMNKIEDADFVLVVATENYNSRFRGKVDANTGKGAQWEGSVITQELYDANGKNEKFIPVIFAGTDETNIPVPLRSATFYDVSRIDRYDELYFYLTNQPAYVPKPLGPVRKRTNYIR